MKTLIIIIFITLLGFFGIKNNVQIVAQITKTEMEKFKTSPNYKDGKFVNLEETPVMNPNSSTFKIMKEFMKKGENREPNSILNTQKFDKAEFLSHSKGVSYAWFGHSTVLLNIDGVIVLCDPFFGERASPVSFAGTKKFAYSNDVTVDEMPNIDFVLISHDHYDHLDAKTIKELDSKIKKYIVPLGVGLHLKKWNVNADKIIELDWWDNYQPDSLCKITLTPSRHFSGRALKRNTTLWGSFAIKINKHNIYFSGDSGYGKHFIEIGKKLGPFDLTFLECGQYNEDWSLIHMNPAETYKAFKDLKGTKMTPLHWGKFKLSLHAWTEPVELLLKESNGDAEQIVIPEIGEIVRLNSTNKMNYWWK